mmetsp:Transcript_17636/g.44021  ORF Transcript_17636/g.44021 Transcript_17636/m.44021 type:complete len:224 (-) Transcript_17636:1838-2509(-)
MALFRTCILLRTAAVGSLVLQGGGLNFSRVHAARPGGSSGEGSEGAGGAGDDHQPVDSHSSPSTPRGPSKEVATPTAPRSPVTTPFQSPVGGRAAPGSPKSPPPPGPTPTTPPPLYRRGAPISLRSNDAGRGGASSGGSLLVLAPRTFWTSTSFCFACGCGPTEASGDERGPVGLRHFVDGLYPLQFHLGLPNGKRVPDRGGPVRKAVPALPPRGRCWRVGAA